MSRLLSASRTYDLVFSGDSLTFGSGASGPQTNYPYVTANSGSRGRWFKNAGVGGETSTEIKDRVIAFSSALKAATQVIWAGRNNYSSPDTVKADIASMVASLGHNRYLVLSVINASYINEWSGNADWTTITTLNADLEALYGSRFVDVRTPLVAAGAPDGVAPNSTDYAHDIPPSGIRSDLVHLNDAGHAIVASTVYERLASLGF